MCMYIYIINIYIYIWVSWYLWWLICQTCFTLGPSVGLWRQHPPWPPRKCLGDLGAGGWKPANLVGCTVCTHETRGFPRNQEIFRNQNRNFRTWHGDFSIKKAKHQHVWKTRSESGNPGIPALRIVRPPGCKQPEIQLAVDAKRWCFFGRRN